MTYADAARRLGLEICPSSGPDCLQPDSDHERGTVDPRGRVIHWKLRRLTRSGLRRFLKITARSRVLNYSTMNRAMQIYAENTWATRAAADLNVRLPAALSTTDRLTVRWLASQGADLTPAAQRWAARKEFRSWT